MTVTIEVKPEVEARLRRRAAREGVPFDEVAADAMEAGLNELESDAAQDEADADEARYRLANPDPRTRRTLADLRAHIQSQGAQRDAA